MIVLMMNNNQNQNISDLRYLHVYTSKPFQPHRYNETRQFKLSTNFEFYKLENFCIVIELLVSGLMLKKDYILLIFEYK